MSRFMRFLIAAYAPLVARHALLDGRVDPAARTPVRDDPSAPGVRISRMPENTPCEKRGADSARLAA